MTFDHNLANQVTQKLLSNAAYMYGVPQDKNEGYTANGLTFNLTYDWNGSLTGDGVWTYTYDIENRLTRATLGQEGVGLFLPASDCRRIHK